MVSSATAADDSSWRRVSVGGCVLVESLCLGVEGSYGSNTGFVTDEIPMPVDRKGVDLSLTVGARIPAGRGIVSPQLGVGIGWLTTSREPMLVPPPPEPGCDGNDPTDPNTPDGTPGIDKENGIIKIGTSQPFTGTAAVAGEGLLAGIQIAVNEINAAGGVDGCMFELVWEDDRFEIEQMVTNVRKIVDI